MRRWVLLSVATFAVALAAVAYGRDEGKRAADVQRQGLLVTRAEVGGRLLHPTQAVYDSAGGLECLVYAFIGNSLGLELCFDSSGRLVESVDRRGRERIFSLRWSRADAPLSISPSNLTVAVTRLPAYARHVGVLP